MQHPFWFARAALLAVMGLAAPAQAETAAPLELVGYVKLEKVTIGASGEREVEWVDPQVVVPGDKLIFGTRYTNRGDAPIERFVVSNPVPASVTVTADVNPALLVSVDGGKAWGALADLTIVDAAGQRRAAATGDITHVRWVLPQVAPGESGQIEFPVTVR